MEQGRLLEVFELRRRKLLADYAHAASYRHSVNVGTRRENVLRNFLEDVLPSGLRVGAGEIISSESSCPVLGRQFDCIISYTDFPSVEVSEGFGLYFIESVFCVIEVKSTLKSEHVAAGCRTAKAIKSTFRSPRLQRISGRVEFPLSYHLFSYASDLRIEYAVDAIKEYCSKNSITIPRSDSEILSRIRLESPVVDSVITLDRGFAWFDNCASGPVDKRDREKYPDCMWFGDWDAMHSLVFLYMYLIEKYNLSRGVMVGFGDYLRDVPVPHVRGLA